MSKEGFWPLACVLGALALCNGSQAAQAETANRASVRARQFADQARWPDFTTGMWMSLGGQASFVDADAGKPGGLFGNPAVTPAAPSPPPASVGDFVAGTMRGANLTDSAKARLEELRKHPREEEFTNCLPPGPTTFAMFPVAFFYAGDSIFIITDMDDFLVRRVVMNRKDHGSPDPSWSGHSIGRWEGDTLVIDTTAISADIKVANLPSGGNLHMVERIRLTSPDQLEWQYTLTDPQVLASPWERTIKLKRHADWELSASSCTQGNRDKANTDGSAGVNLSVK